LLSFNYLTGLVVIFSCAPGKKYAPEPSKAAQKMQRNKIKKNIKKTNKQTNTKQTQTKTKQTKTSNKLIIIIDYKTKKSSKQNKTYY